MSYVFQFDTKEGTSDYQLRTLSEPMNENFVVLFITSSGCLKVHWKVINNHAQKETINSNPGNYVPIRPVCTSQYTSNSYVQYESKTVCTSVESLKVRL